MNRTYINIEHGSHLETSINLYDRGTLYKLHSYLESIFGHSRYLIITDETIWKAVGDYFSNFLEHETNTAIYILPASPAPYASSELLNIITRRIALENAIPIAVGSGTINDLVKRASFENSIRYVCIPTAPSVDGYASFGAAITINGFKETVECPPPLCIIADEDIITKAPPQLIASGYGDIIAKLVSGADWIIADSLGIEMIDPVAWKLAQDASIALFSQAKQVYQGLVSSINMLYRGLISTGLAIQEYKDSRPASGTEHLLSHTWEMLQHQNDKEKYSHGFKVAIGSLISCALMSELFSQNGALRKLVENKGFSPIDNLLQYRLDVMELLDADPLLKSEIEKTITSKTPSIFELRSRIERAHQVWPELSKKVMIQIPSFLELKQAFSDASCPTEPGQIGLSRSECINSIKIASLIRRRYTVLDLASELGVLDAAADVVFSSKYFTYFAKK